MKEEAENSCPSDETLKPDGVSGELSTALFANFKKVTPFANTLMISLSNDRAGYIPDDANWDHWHNAAFVKGCAEGAIINNLVEMMNESLT